jgi:hypothetical protein
MLRGMRKILAITTFLATIAALAASIALAATPTGSQAFAGNTTHGHYHVSIITSCSGRKCSAATTAAIAIKAGNPIHPVKGCPYGGFGLPTAKIKQGKFSVSTEFVVSGKLLKFGVSGNFTAAKKVKGTVTGPSACGTSDAYTFSGKKINLPTIGGTGATVTNQ